MTRHWYAVHTRPQKEKKVSAILTKKGIENFCPVTTINDLRVNIKREGFESLLNSYVFVNIFESELQTIKNIQGIVNVVYYKSSPAIIADKEIDIMRQLTASYTSIKLEKTVVDMNATVRLIGEPVVAYGENSVSLRHQCIKVNFPSLGFSMTAERTKAKEKIIYKQAGEQQSGLLSFFPKRLNTFFFT